MSSNSETIFVKIKDADEKQQILEDILKHRKDVVIKSNSVGGDIVPIDPLSFVRNKLTCRLPAGEAQLKTITQAILQFTVGEDKFLALCACQISGDCIILNMDTDIFKIQRRKDFRLKLPSSFRAHFLILFVDGKPVNIHLPLIDLSAGGCRVEIDKNISKLKLNDQFDGEIFLSKRKEIPLSGIVKYVLPHPTEDDRLLLGIQFMPLSSIAKDRMVGVVMDLYKELFSRI